MQSNEITVTVTTRGRYFTTLPLCLMSICNQTLLPKKVILVDDNTNKEFQQLDIMKHLMFLFKQKNVEFHYYHGQSKGQVYAQQIAFEKADTNWVFKLDDDNILENNVLEELFFSFPSNSVADVNYKVGALSCLILTKDDLNRKLEYVADVYNKVEDIYSKFNIQMVPNQTREIKQAEHLHGCYLFKKEATEGYPLDFSPAGHREDTVFTHAIFQKGYKLLVNPNVIIWHLKEKSGGNRVHSGNAKNELLFIEKLKEWGVIPDKLKLEQSGDYVYVIKDNEKYLVPSLCKNIETD